MDKVTKLKNFLEKTAEKEDLSSYYSAGRVVNLHQGSWELWGLLGKCARESYEENGTLLSAIVVNLSGMPGNSFFELAEELTGEPITDRLDFWIDAVTKVHNHYSANSNQNGPSDEKKHG